MQKEGKVAIADLNECITCKLCKGYYVDATTIIECLHTFCRSCIVRYLEKNKYCPICDVQVHKTKPLLNIRPDKTVQDVVYKLVPRLYHREVQRRKTFYENHPEAQASASEQASEEAYEYILAPEESICLTIKYDGSSELPRFLRCPAAVSIFHLHKLLRAKFDLSDRHLVEVMYNQDCLSPNLTLMDVAYIYSWKRKTPLDLTYKIYDCTSKKMKLEENPKESVEQVQENNQQSNNLANNNNPNSNSNWKEVQLRISESGEMSIIEENNSSLLDIIENNERNLENDNKISIINDRPVSESKNPDQIPTDTIQSSPVNTVTESSSINVDQSKSTPNAVESITSNENLTENKPTVSEPPIKSLNSQLTITKKELPGLKFIGKTNTSSASNAMSTYTPKKPTKLNNIQESDSTKSTVSNNKRPIDIISIINITSNASTTCENVMNDMLTLTPHSASLTAGVTTMVFSTINDTKCSTKTSEDTQPEKGLKRKKEDEDSAVVPPKIPKQTILNHSLGLLNLSNNHPLKKHASKFNNNRGGSETTPSKQKILLNRTCGDKTNVTNASNVTNVSNVISVTTTSTTDGKPLNIVNSNAGTVKSTVSGHNKLSNTPCYMPKTSYTPVINVPKPTVSSGTKIMNEKGVKVEQNAALSITPLTKTAMTINTTQIPPITTVSSQSVTQKTQVSQSQSQKTHPPTPTTQSHSQRNQLSQSQLQKSQPPQNQSTQNQSQISQQKSQIMQNASQMSQQKSQSHTPQPQISQNQSQLTQQTTTNSSKAQAIKTKPSTPIGYKTLRDPPKSWNSQISKANLTKSAPNNAKYTDLKSVRPPKFFKGRFMPRYLGNPASGVKPMYQVHITPEMNQNDDTSNTNVTKVEKSEIKKHSIVKIDPKTLKPISEKAPEMSNLTNVSSTLSLNNQNHHELRLNPQDLKLNPNITGDLKINTSSVSIFNPLKLQSSPKSDRRSPKSPHSPKIKTTLNCSTSVNTTTSYSPSPASPSAPPPLKRPDKSINQLNFTPPNPFVPNLASPTLNPNPFLYPPSAGFPPAPGGFPPYDPRVMAAYHSLWYGRGLGGAMGAMGGVGGVMGVGGFDLGVAAGVAAANKGALSPKMQQGQHSPGVSPKHLSSASQVSPLTSISQQRSQTMQQLSKSPTSRKNRSDQNGKNEKSLENTVEKLTQNKAKELGLLNHKNSTKNSSPQLKSDEKSDKNATSNVKPSKKGSNKVQEGVSCDVTKQVTTGTTTTAKPSVANRDSGGGMTSTNQAPAQTLTSDACQSRLQDGANVNQTSKNGDVSAKTVQGDVKSSDNDANDSDRIVVNDKNGVENSGSNKNSNGSKFSDLNKNRSCKDTPVEGGSSSSGSWEEVGEKKAEVQK